MKLTSRQALDILREFEKESNNLGWVKHSICVGDSAAKIAEELNLDADKAKCLGYIHMI